MTRIALIALLAATAAPALAADFTPAQPDMIAARDIGDRADSHSIGARDIGDRKDYKVSELSRDERGGVAQPKARDIADRKDRGTV
ncbi:hypothetical protein [Roseovarius sp. Pro17]|uniref:hypothetical protein n=1 Tax=Roseovarius sp. Pro17 TaxID=3108175 RepID=UPI002D78CD2B|nr:hypothetical protein [Roseovarius sp. Pro17]